MIKLSKTSRLFLMGVVLVPLLSLSALAQNQQDDAQFDDGDDDYVNDFMNNENGVNANKNANQQNNQNTNQQNNQNANNNFQENLQNNTQQGNVKPKNGAAGNAIRNGNNNFNNANFNNFNNQGQIEVQAEDIQGVEAVQGDFSLQGQAVQGVQGAAEDQIINEPIGNPVNPLPNNGGVVDETVPATDTAVAPVEEETVQPLPDNEEGPVVPAVAEVNEFAGAPPVFGTRRVVALGEAPEEYAVEPGDTLYDICDQLIDEPDYWPKLWALNPDIKNPHFIYPGVKLTFYPGDSETPPFLQLVTENDVVPVDRADIRPEELVERQDISALLLNLTKNSTGTPIIGPNDLTGADGVETQLVVVGGTLRPDRVMVTIPAFLYESKRDPLGVVVGGVAGSVLTDKNDDVILRNQAGLNAGTTYTVLRETQDVYSGERFVGKRYEFVAHIRVTERASGENLFLAKVTENRLGVQPGDYIMPYKSTTRIVAIGGVPPPSGGSGNAILGFENPDMNIGGQGSLVLIDTKEKAMTVGQTVAVYQDVNRSASPFIKDQLPDVARNVGIVRIIDNTGVGAVGYVLTVRREIRVGDRAGKG